MQEKKLYKKNTNGSIQYWSVSVEEVKADSGQLFGKIITRFGQVGGKEQVGEEIIKLGKNIGKSNETTPLQQAQAEAQSDYEGKIKKGYVEKLDDAEAGKDNIGCGVNPMLAHKFAEQGHKINYPCYISPKLDGIRVVAVIENGKCELFSRTRKPFISMPHIVAELEHIFKGQSIILDGEGYNQSFKDNFEHITHLIGQKTEPDPEHTDVQYHIFDIVSKEPYSKRLANINNLIPDDARYLRKVESKLVNSLEDVIEGFRAYRNQGYEGAMARNAESLYENKRSYNLQKIKEMDDDEFDIIGIVEGKGRLVGHAIFSCVTKDGVDFEAKLRGPTEKLKEYFENHALWKSKRLTVQYQGWTKNKKPRFAVGVRLREDL